MKISLSRSRNGFTLVELLVVIVIVAVLAAIGISAVFSFRNSADEAVAVGNMRQIQIANVSYASDNNGRFVPPETTIDKTTYRWFENPEFVSQLKTEDATYTTSGPPDVSLPISLMDPQVARNKQGNYESLGASYAYTRPADGEAVRMSRLTSDSRSAAFITADDAFVDHASRTEIAYRHDDSKKAVVVFYDGHASTITRQDIDRIDTKGGASNHFWDPVRQ